MQYQVPQFIEIEDKIFGPFTLKQFLYLAGGIAIGFILWSFLPRWLAIIVGAPIVGFFMALAFYQVNGRPFIDTVESAVKYFFQSKLYIWHKKDKKIEPKKEEEKAESDVFMPKMSDSKLREMTWALDINEKIKGENEKTTNNLIR